MGGGEGCGGQCQFGWNWMGGIVLGFNLLKILGIGKISKKIPTFYAPSLILTTAHLCHFRFECCTGSSEIQFGYFNGWNKWCFTRIWFSGKCFFSIFISFLCCISCFSLVVLHCLSSCFLVNNYNNSVTVVVAVDFIFVIVFLNDVIAVDLWKNDILQDFDPKVTGFNSLKLTGMV